MSRSGSDWPTACSMMRSTSVSATTLDRVAASPRARPRRCARRRSCAAIPRPRRTGRDRRLPAGASRAPAAASRTSVDLPMPGSPPRRTSDAGHQAATQHAVELAECRVRRAAQGSSAGRAERHRARLPPAGERCTAPRATCGAGARGSSVSTRVFQAPQVRHCPSQRRNDSRRRPGTRSGSGPGHGS